MAAAAPPQQVSDDSGDLVKQRFEEFLQSFYEPDADREAASTYAAQVQAMRANDRSTIYVDFAHLAAHDYLLGDAVKENHYRFDPYLGKAVQNFVRRIDPAYVADEGGDREFSVGFFNIAETCKIRDLRTERIGHLVAVSGTVTRTSEVRPELVYGAFTCSECQTHTTIHQQFRYTEPPQCANQQCQNHTNWKLNLEQSVFVDWQRVRVQENADEIPPGAMPRTIDIVLRNETVERAKPGDKCVFVGTLCVVPETDAKDAPGQRVHSVRGGAALPTGVNGIKKFGVKDLNYRMTFLASTVQPAGARFSLNGADDDDSVVDDLTEAEKAEILRMRNQPNLYARIVESVAPTVFGHEDVKKGILLMMFGGVHKSTKERINLRGDINVCIVGDPSTAKSQFLKWVSGFLPRAVYTSGKSASAAGLTASVVRDGETGEATIEAGALMLADHGVCCIDEFDKMEVKDQVAIHEAMEQQTITLSKGGIQATLNARTSILAAANPQDGRYDRSKTLRQNVDMSPAIMSRFDLFFVVLDECEEAQDFALARHIVGLHKNREQALHPDFSHDQLLRYIKFARSLKPTIPPQSAQLLANSYRALKQWDSTQGGKSSYRVTVRQLEAMVRLSEAIARLECSDEVTPAHVNEAKRLLRKSIITVEKGQLDLWDFAEDQQAGMDIGMDEDQGEPGNDGDEGPAEDGDDGKDDDQPGDGPPAPQRGAGDDADYRDGDDEPQPEDEDREPAAAAPKRGKIKEKVRITYEKYQSVSRALMLHLRKREKGMTRKEAGMTRKALVDWYLSLQTEISGQEELLQEAKLIRSVIKNMQKKDGKLVAVEGATDGDGEPILVVHPNIPDE